MEKKQLALYPFISEASAYVSQLDFSLEKLINSRAFYPVRIRAVERISEALGQGIEKPLFLVSDENKIDIELLSYPFSRVLVSCINDPFLIRRYSLGEAVACYNLLKTESYEIIDSIASDFKIKMDLYDNKCKIHFTDYIQYANSMKALEWKLVNRKINKGYVFLFKEEFARLLQEAIKNRIETSLPLKVSSDIDEKCKSYTTSIKEQLQQMKESYRSENLGEVQTDLFPPCIIHAISNAKAGINLAHSMRFALTSFLLNVGMSTNNILALFNVSPDFDVEKTRYQIEHISGASGTEYKSPACATMLTYGNCYNPDQLCGKIKHPLTYYKRKTWAYNKDQENIDVV